MSPERLKLLADFDELPDDAIVDDDTSAAFLNISKATLHRRNPVQRRLTGIRSGGRRVGDLRALTRGATPGR
jgi:hypothetical protein